MRSYWRSGSIGDMRKGDSKYDKNEGKSEDALVIRWHGDRTREWGREGGAQNGFVRFSVWSVFPTPVSSSSSMSHGNRSAIYRPTEDYPNMARQRTSPRVCGKERVAIKKGKIRRLWDSNPGPRVATQDNTVREVPVQAPVAASIFFKSLLQHNTPSNRDKTQHRKHRKSRTQN